MADVTRNLWPYSRRAAIIMALVILLVRLKLYWHLNYLASQIVTVPKRTIQITAILEALSTLTLGGVYRKIDGIKR